MASNEVPDLTVEVSGQLLTVDIALSRTSFYGGGVKVLTVEVDGTTPVVDANGVQAFTTDVVVYSDAELTTPVTLPVDLTADTTFYFDWRDRGKYTVTSSWTNGGQVLSTHDVLVAPGTHTRVTPMPSFAQVVALTAPKGA